MKRIILTAFLLSLISVTAHAQYVGIKGGLNLSNLNIDEVNDENMRAGYHFGAYFNLPISDGFAIQPEVLYSTKGAEAEYDIVGIDGTAKLKLDYIDIPILAVFRFGDALELHAGPYFGFLANSKYEIDGDFDDASDLDSDNFKGLDYGLAAGLAVNLSALQIGARYNYGLQEVQDSDAAEFVIGDAKNSYFQVFAAIRLGNYD